MSYLSVITTKPKNMSNLQESLEFQVRELEREVAEETQRLQRDFVFNFAWVGESLWKNSYKLKHLKNLLNHDNIEIRIKDKISLLQDEVSKSFNVIENSTSQLHRDCSIWEFQSNLDILKLLKVLVKLNKL